MYEESKKLEPVAAMFVLVILGSTERTVITTSVTMMVIPMRATAVTTAGVSRRASLRRLIGGAAYLVKRTINVVAVLVAMR